MVLAGIAGYVAYRLFQVESKRDERLEKLAFEQQATSVGVWMEGTSKLIIANLSPLPVYRFGVRYRAEFNKSMAIIGGAKISDAQTELLTDKLARYANIDLHQFSRAALKPGEHLDCALPTIDWLGFRDYAETKLWSDEDLDRKQLSLEPRTPAGREVLATLPDESLYAHFDLFVDVYFTDNARQKWRRDPDGGLDPLETPPLWD